MTILERFKGTVDWMTNKGIPADKVPEEIKEKRMGICHECPTNDFFKPTSQCKRCWCFMEIKSGLVYDPIRSMKEGQVVNSKCPAGHWPEFHINIESS